MPQDNPRWEVVDPFDLLAIFRPSWGIKLALIALARSWDNMSSIISTMINVPPFPVLWPLGESSVNKSAHNSLHLQIFLGPGMLLRLAHLSWTGCRSPTILFLHPPPGIPSSLRSRTCWSCDWRGCGCCCTQWSSNQRVARDRKRLRFTFSFDRSGPPRVLY